MFMSEHQSKELLSQYGLPVPAARLAKTAEEAERRCAEIGARKYVVKAQIIAGGRGPAGGVQFAATPSAVADAAGQLLGHRLVTAQTGPQGEAVPAVSVQEALDLTERYFIALVLDPSTGAPMVLASAQGGSDIEARVEKDPSLLVSMLLGPDSAETRSALSDFLAGIGITENPPLEILFAARQAFIEADMTLLEINPFARTKDGAWSVVDAKIALDNGALFRHPEFDALADHQGLSDSEMEAQRNNINLVPLDGSIGVVVNGAGLGLATNDMVHDAGGRPANFMDIRTTATSFDIAKGVSLLLAEPKAKVILLNVHGGGMTACDTVAEGVSFAYSKSKRKLPIVARLAGQNADWGVKILQDRLLPVEVCSTLSGAVARAVDLAS
ncbi:MAG: ATP-grasp domain-containing protein [Pseudomonadota bacterium]